jgi:outer membrane lipoprotein-sorting protein
MRVTQVNRRWLVPVAAVAVIGAGAAVGPAVAGASPDLPGITAQQLLANVQTAKVDGLSGTFKMSADLGLPALPSGMGGPSQSQLTDLLSGDHTIRVAYAAPDKARVSVLDNMSERVLVTDGKTAWVYDSHEHTAIKKTVPAHPERSARPQVTQDPQTLAKQFLAAIDPTTKVSVTGTRSVAGRDAYLLTLTPRTDRTTVGSVTIAVDSKTWTPLRITVMPRSGGNPAIDAGFTDVSFATPAASTFAFTPPPGTKVSDEGTDQGGSTAVPNRPFPHQPNGTRPPQRNLGAAPPTVIGTGGDAVAVTHFNADTTSNGMLQQLLAKAPSISGSWGTGKVVSSRMVTALVTDDGRLMIGFVPQSVLEQAAAKAPR